jgi:hypothetical protein
VNVEPVATPEPKKRSSALKPKTAAAPVHNRTHRKAKTEAPTAAPSFKPAHEEIARRAYLYAESRGFQGGSPEEDWLRAERDLMELAKNR